MPGPFPGMDPYLEDPILWPGVHQRFITYLADALSLTLPTRYVANLNERLYIGQPERAIIPDAMVLERSSPARPPRGNPGAVGGVAVAVAEEVAADPPWVLEADEVREGYIEILRARQPDRVVAVIELLSPSNKAAGTEGRRAYAAKQRDVLLGAAHLIEIDLLRGGEHSVAASPDGLARCGAYDYVCSLSRGDRRHIVEAWTSTVRRRLSRITLPLIEGDPDLVVDLQPLIDHCYDAGTYERRIDYSLDPPAPGFSRADMEWIDGFLRDRNLRS